MTATAASLQREGDRLRLSGTLDRSAATALWPQATAALAGARRRRLLPTVLATAVAMALTMGYWELMVRYFDRRR